MSKFHEGDVVELKSGGPKMTVNQVLLGDTGVWAIWFDGAKHQRAFFNDHAVELANGEPSKK
jgi:uncharacterized protein YodC (DUF2158 family)